MGVEELVERVHGRECACHRCQGFQPGNRMRETHGAYVADPRLDEDPRVERWVAWILQTQPVEHAADLGAVWRLGRVYVRIERSARALDDADAAIGDQHRGVAYGEHKEWLASLRDDHDRWLSRAGRIEAELGRTPLSRSKLGLNVAAMRRELSVIDYYEARERAGLSLSEDEGDE